MIGFLGEYEATMDAKGRFLLPAGFKKQLSEVGAGQFVINRGIEACLSLYPMQSWEPIFAEVSKLNEFDPKKKKSYAAAALALDKQYNKELNALIKVDLAAYKKAQAAWDNRQETLLQKSQVRNLIASCTAFIVDEAHVASVVIEELGKQAKNAYYRLGLSGTPWRMDNQEIRIEGTLGRKIIEVSASDLIELGFLVPPKIFVCNVAENNGGETYADIYSNNIVNNWERNYRIKQFAEGFKEAGRPTLILVERR